MAVICKICLNEYSGKIIPKMMICGHSICSHCLASILENDEQSFCPFCRGVLHGKEVCMYPTNLALFEYVAKESSIFLENSNAIKHLPLRLSNAPIHLHRSNEYPNEISFLKMIQKELFSGRHMIKACCIVNGEFKYANIGVTFGILFVESLRAEKCSIRDVIVDFEDLLNILQDNSTSIDGYIDLTNHAQNLPQRAVINVHRRNTHLGTKFLKFCSGELGVSYTSKTFVQNYLEDVVPRGYAVPFVNKIIEVEGFGDYASDTTNEKFFDNFLEVKFRSMFTYDGKNCYVSCNPDGALEIFKVKTCFEGLVCSNVIGSVKDFPHFEEEFKNTQYPVILTCGVVFELKEESQIKLCCNSNRVI